MNRKTRIVEGKTLRQIAEESGQKYKAIEERYKNPRIPNTVKALTTDHKRTMNLLGLGSRDWAKFLTIRGDKGEVTISKVQHYVCYHRKKGRDDKTIARNLMIAYGIDPKTLTNQPRSHRSQNHQEGQD